jgi:hypothetical protein
MSNRWYEEIQAERLKQNEEWGGPDHDDGHTSWDWIAYLVKHVGKAVMWPFNLEVYRQQMIRVAALAVAAFEWADRLGLQPTTTRSKVPPEFTGIPKRSNYGTIKNLVAAFKAIDKLDPKRVDVYTGLSHMREILNDNSEVQINSMPAMEGLINNYKGIVLRFEIDRGIRLDWPGRAPHDPQEKAGEGDLHAKIMASVRDVCSGIPPGSPPEPESSEPGFFTGQSETHICPESDTCSDKGSCTHAIPHEWRKERCFSTDQPRDCPKTCVPVPAKTSVHHEKKGGVVGNRWVRQQYANDMNRSCIASTDAMVSKQYVDWLEDKATLYFLPPAKKIQPGVISGARSESPLDDDGRVGAGRSKGLSKDEVADRYCVKVYENPNGTLCSVKGVFSEKQKPIGYLLLCNPDAESPVAGKK